MGVEVGVGMVVVGVGVAVVGRNGMGWGMSRCMGGRKEREN
jgi:hypothetical protein